MRQVNNYRKILPSQQLHLQIQLSRFEILYHKKYKLVYHSYVRAPLRRVRQFLLLPLPSSPPRFITQLLREERGLLGASESAENKGVFSFRESLRTPTRVGGWGLALGFSMAGFDSFRYTKRKGSFTTEEQLCYIC